MALPSLISMVSTSYIQWIKFEIKEKLEEKNLQTIILNNQDISWYEIDHEIIVNGALFDVKSYATQGNQTTFHGIFDQKESAMAQIAENTVGNSNQNKQLIQIAGFFQLLQCNHYTEAYHLKRFPTPTVFLTVQEDPPSFPFLSIPTPPPDRRLS